jgi:hypothetical protein
MPPETVTSGNPDNTNVSGAGGDNTPIVPQNNGNRADTSRVADVTGGNPPLETTKEKTFSFKEDRSDWIPRTRLNEESGKRTKLESDLAQARTQAEMNEKKLRIAMGLEVVKPEDQEAAEIREALFKAHPKLKLLERLDEDTIDRILGAADSATSATQAQWNRHRDGMLSTLKEDAAELLGVEKLSDAQAKRLDRAFREEAREQAQARARAAEAQDSTYDFANDFVMRYERGDKTLLQEFAKSYIEDWGIPARRQANTSAFDRQNRPVPRGGRSRTTLTTGVPKIDYNDDNAFKNAMIAARTGGGEV